MRTTPVNGPFDVQPNPGVPHLSVRSIEKEHTQTLRKIWLGYAFIAIGLFTTIKGLTDVFTDQPIMSRGIEIIPSLYFFATIGMIVIGYGFFYYNRDERK